jgi:hypothetical protein
LSSQQRTNQSKHFWHLRYQVQEIGPLFHEQSQRAISTRLTVLNGIGRFDAKAILQTKVRQVVKELLRRVSELKQDKHRLRVRSRRLMRRLSGNIWVRLKWRQFSQASQGSNVPQASSTECISQLKKYHILLSLNPLCQRLTNQSL